MKILHIGKKGNMERYTNSSVNLEKYEMIDMHKDTPVSELLYAGADADVIIVDAITSISAELIQRMSNLKLIHSEGVAFNAIDVATATEKGIYVCNCSGMNGAAVAEQTILLMLGVLKDAVNNDAAVRIGKQIEVKEGYMVRGDLKELADCTVGLVGFGAIAQAVARLTKAFGVETYYYSRHRASTEIEAETGAKYLPLDELLATCNMISMHVPVTPETKEMANDAFFAKMQEGSYFINTARGEVVDEHALVRAIECGKVAMAGLDTLSGEPVKTDHILINQKPEIEKRIFFSPHIGGITASSFKRGYEIIWKNVQKLEAGQKPENIVNRIS